MKIRIKKSVLKQVAAQVLNQRMQADNEAKRKFNRLIEQRDKLQLKLQEINQAILQMIGRYDNIL